VIVRLSMKLETACEIDAHSVFQVNEVQID
jgi:hypothetical protein